MTKNERDIVILAIPMPRAGCDPVNSSVIRPCSTLELRVGPEHQKLTKKPICENGTVDAREHD